MTPQQLNQWAEQADRGEAVELSGEQLRELAAYVRFADRLAEIARHRDHHEIYPGQKEVLLKDTGWSMPYD